jgi:hypothetical protein
MTNYLADLRKHINIFLWNSIHHSAQWVNKPKFHMLLHLPESILRFGPASLFSTENFESFNGLLRKASVHSNCLHPGRDLALTFLNFEAHCLILSGSCIWNPQTHANTIAGNDVVHLFKTNGCIKKSMGYNPSLLAASHTFLSPIQLPLTLEAKKSILAELELLPDSQVLQVASLRLSPWDIVAKGYFVLVRLPSNMLKKLQFRKFSDTAHSIRLPMVAKHPILPLPKCNHCGRCNSPARRVTLFAHECLCVGKSATSIRCASCKAPKVIVITLFQ